MRPALVRRGAHTLFGSHDRESPRQRVTTDACFPHPTARDNICKRL